MAVAPDGTLTVASAGAGVLTIGDHSHATGAVTETVAVASDGRVATASALEGVVSVFGPGGEQRYEVGGRPVRVAFSPDGNVLAAALSAGHGVALIEDGQVQVVAIEGVPDGLAFSSDGRYLYASDVFGGVVTAVEVDRRAVAAVIPVGQATGAMLVLAP